MKDFKKLVVWQKGLENFISIHLFARKLPQEEKYELASQIRRAAFSIPANIAEGSAKATNLHYKLILENALGSSYEVKTALLLFKSYTCTFRRRLKNFKAKILRFKKC